MEFPIRERTEGPRAISANQAPAIRDKAIHRFADNKVECPQENAVALGPTSA